MSLSIKIYVAIGILLVLLSIPICEMTNYGPLAEYEKGSWSPFKTNQEH